MKTIKRKVKQAALAVALIVAGLAAISPIRFDSAKPARSESESTNFVGHKLKEDRHVRIRHARELLGAAYDTSIVRRGESVAKINSHIYAWTKKRLPARYREQSRQIAQAIIDNSQKYRFDPVFLMAVIEGESSFDPSRKGHFGEIGLMQLKPSTAQWVAQKAKIKFRGASSLTKPIENIRLGAAYLYWLRNKFGGHAQLYLAAYNMGQRNVAQAVSNRIWPKDYPIHVMSRYINYYQQLRSATSTKRQLPRDKSSAEVI